MRKAWVGVSRNLEVAMPIAGVGSSARIQRVKGASSSFIPRQGCPSIILDTSRTKWIVAHIVARWARQETHYEA